MLISIETYLILSGGLGSSPYVRQRLKSHFDTGLGSLKPNAPGVKIVTVVEPSVDFNSYPKIFPLIFLLTVNWLWSMV